MASRLDDMQLLSLQRRIDAIHKDNQEYLDRIAERVDKRLTSIEERLRKLEHV